MTKEEWIRLNWSPLEGEKAESFSESSKSQSTLNRLIVSGPCCCSSSVYRREKKAGTNIPNGDSFLFLFSSHIVNFWEGPGGQACRHRQHISGGGKLLSRDAAKRGDFRKLIFNWIQYRDIPLLTSLPMNISAADTTRWCFKKYSKEGEEKQIFSLFFAGFIQTFKLICFIISPSFSSSVLHKKISGHRPHSWNWNFASSSLHSFSKSSFLRCRCSFSCWIDLQAFFLTMCHFRERLTKAFFSRNLIMSSASARCY